MQNALTNIEMKLPWECQQTQELQKGGNEHGSGQIEEEWLYNLILIKQDQVRSSKVKSSPHAQHLRCSLSKLLISVQTIVNTKPQYIVPTMSD